MNVALHAHQVAVICSTLKNPDSAPYNVSAAASVDQVLFERRMANVLNQQHVAQARMKFIKSVVLVVLQDVVFRQRNVSVSKVVSARKALFAKTIQQTVLAFVEHNVRQTILLFFSNHLFHIL